MSRDVKSIQKLWENQSIAPIVEIDDLFTVTSLDGTGEVILTGTVKIIGKATFEWLRPLEVIGVEEAEVSSSRYSPKTLELLETFRPGSENREILKGFVQLLAKEEADDGQYTEYGGVTFIWNKKLQTPVPADSISQQTRRIPTLAALWKSQNNT